MLMRPTVLPTPGIGRRCGDEERNKLSGVKQAELEIRQEEEDRNAAIEAELLKDAAKRAEKAKKEAKKKPIPPNFNRPDGLFSRRGRGERRAEIGAMRCNLLPDSNLRLCQKRHCVLSLRSLRLCASLSFLPLG
jgi:hypothetical protein